jgi:hypothetical protein
MHVPTRRAERTIPVVKGGGDAFGIGGRKGRERGERGKEESERGKEESAREEKRG